MYMRNNFMTKKLVSDIKHLAYRVDSDLINPWDVHTNDDGIWLASNNTGLIELYDFCGKHSRSINVLIAVGNLVNGNPTGLTFNCKKNDFLVENPITHVKEHAEFITVTENGTINGYNSSIDFKNALPMVSSPGKVFKGVTIAKSMLYVCNFNSGYIEVYDATFTFKMQFTDPILAAIGYAPFNVRYFDHKLYVTFAKQDNTKHDNIAGLGNGYISVFDLDGTFEKQFYGRGVLNSPWALVQTCMLVNDHKKNVLLVGNFGNGVINVFDFNHGTFLFPLKDCNKNTIAIDGLWGLTQHHGELIFAAGIDDEAHGLMGLLKQ